MDKSDTADTDKNIDELSVKLFIIPLLACLQITADYLDLPQTKLQSNQIQRVLITNEKRVGYEKHLSYISS